MIVGEQPKRTNPTVQIPPWTFLEDAGMDVYSHSSPGSGGSSGSVKCDGCSSGGGYSPYYLQEALAMLKRYLPSNEAEMDSDIDVSGKEMDSPVDAYSSDQFRMYEFKIKKCTRGRSHDWTECPFAHPGEKARRRDPRRYYYSGTACADFRKGSCVKGDACEFAHGVFECWLHPARYRTQPCKDGTSCRRRVCFFAHTPEQLRVLPQQSPRSTTSIPSYDGSPLRQAIEACAKQMPYLSSPGTSPPVSPRIESPPQSPIIKSLNRPHAPSSINEMIASLRNLQLNKELCKVQSPSSSSSWNVQVGSPVFGSPKDSTTRSGLPSLPETSTPPGIRYLDFWELGIGEEPAMERVESGRDLRAKMFEKLRKENSVGCGDQDKNSGGAGGLDVGWISELLK
ncbi:zinc finger CCCH domain-containing protein 20-like [Cucumis melo var. makuwa]|uniref:Zinc finger CCCH domain-containing protein 20-like n=1 Tax=Cucumis melo var. makuwa TaxID=1194695 RepID=A0A5A7V3Q9_CUCMM|nr:zinc finger CCCH domain-containing protein 20-like [Cucumis melo var. makuwa]